MNEGAIVVLVSAAIWGIGLMDFHYYAKTPLELRTEHWWYMFPGGGFLAFHIFKVRGK